MRRDSNDWSPEAVRAELADGVPREEPDDGRLARLAARAFFLLGRGDTALDATLVNFYPEYARRVAADDRGWIFTCIRDQARGGLLHGNVLVPFLRGDPERQIVSDAAFEMACLGVAEAPDGARGADLVLALVVTGSVLNPGAALGGLLTLANADVNEKLRVLRPALALPGADQALEQMTKCVSEHVHAATVEFWLEWMEALVAGLPGARRPLDRAADALACQRAAMVEQVVLDGGRMLPIPHPGAHPEVRTREIPLHEFAASIGPRLSALASAAPDSASVRRALAVWGLVH